MDTDVLGGGHPEIVASLLRMAVKHGRGNIFEQL